MRLNKPLLRLNQVLSYFLQVIFVKKELHLPKFIFLWFVCCLAACNGNSNKIKSMRFTQDSTAVYNYIRGGDSIYAAKANYLSFSKSLELYDTAWQIAVETNDTSLIALSIYAKGRAFDAINNNPQKTIDYYTQAALLYETMPKKQQKSLYIKHLVAHSYDKVKDSIHCIKILNELYATMINKPDSDRKKMGFIAEMALISTEVNNYYLADSILQHLSKRGWIKNDSTEYDYLNHYYLTRARIDVFLRQNRKSPYLDSLENVLKQSHNLSDSMYYSMQLYNLYKHTKNSLKENYYLQLNNSVFNIFNSPEKVRETQEKVAKMEVATVEIQHKIALNQARYRKISIYILTGMLAIISLLALFLKKRNNEIKIKRNEAVITNQQLEQKNLQNELLNKEIQHRVKNNLQMILSLVYMQERNSDTIEVKENMQSIRLRIENIAELHQQLIEQADEVDLKIYLQKVVASSSNLMGAYKNIVTNLNVQPLKVPQKISFPLGLIINEFITNSVKYADPVTSPLTLFIEIFNTGNEIRVNYRDNGKPQTVKKNKKSLGLDIVNLLMAQLNATDQRNTENIFSYILIIPYKSGE